MSIFDDQPIRKPARHEIGQDISLLSVDDLTTRIGELKAEIARLEAELATKGTTRTAAEALFSRR